MFITTETSKAESIRSWDRMAVVLPSLILECAWITFYSCFNSDNMEPGTYRHQSHSWVTSTFDDSLVPSVRNKNRSKRIKRCHVECLPKIPTRKLWIDKYRPLSKDNLAVHKKKIQEVETWIVESLTRSAEGKILLLTGPSGSGKTATVHILANEYNLCLTEWTNPSSVASYDNFQSDDVGHNINFIPGDYVPSTSQRTLFWDFLLRTSRYSCVTVEGKAHQGSLVMVEEFPNAFYRDSAEFHSLLRSYKRRTNASPVIFIISDTTSLETSSRKLFPQDLKEELSVRHISFNPIAASFVCKALSQIGDQEEKNFTSVDVFSKASLAAIAESSNGDIRNAINTLQFMVQKGSKDGNGTCMRGSFLMSGSRRTKSKRSSNASHPPPSEPKDTAQLGGKDSPLFLFHALGKVLYCKRDTERGVVDVLPKHLKQHERAPLIENAEAVLDSVGCENFPLFLHQNMLSFFTSIEDVSGAMDYFTDAETISSEWTGRDVLREMALSLSVRGLMHSQKDGISRRVFRPLKKPMWYRITKESQEREFALRDSSRHLGLCLEETATVYAPYCVLIKQSGCPGPMRDVGRFHSRSCQSGCSDKLCEDDANEDYEACVEFVHPRRAYSCGTAVISDELEEGCIIEDFDDL